MEGHVVDVACLRTIPSSQIGEEAKSHTTACALMGHCMESGYGLVGPDGRVALLDPKATPHVVSVLNHTTVERGVWLRVEREQKGEKMETQSVSEAEAP